MRSGELTDCKERGKEVRKEVSLEKSVGRGSTSIITILPILIYIYNRCVKCFFILVFLPYLLPYFLKKQGKKGEGSKEGSKLKSVGNDIPVVHVFYNQEFVNL